MTLSTTFEALMTVQQVADSIKVSPRTIQRKVSKLYPGLMKKGFPTYLDEAQVTRIKQRIYDENSHLDRSVEVSTSLEIEEMTLKVIAF